MNRRARIVGILAEVDRAREVAFPDKWLSTLLFLYSWIALRSFIALETSL